MSRLSDEKLSVPFKTLKQTQKARIADWMYRETLCYYLEMGGMPVGDEIERLAQIVYDKSQCYGISFDEIRELFQHRQEKYELRIRRDMENGVTFESLQKTVKNKKPGKQKRPKKRTAKAEASGLSWQDDHFFFIAGYTSGGAPYGVTWEEIEQELVESDLSES